MTKAGDPAPLPGETPGPNSGGDAGDLAEDLQGASLHARVSGRVQGVGFRFFVVRAARSLGLAGRVRNNLDGTVELWARGTRGQLAALLAKVHEGPRMGRVDHVIVEWGDSNARVAGSAQEFVIES